MLSTWITASVLALSVMGSPLLERYHDIERRDDDFFSKRHSLKFTGLGTKFEITIDGLHMCASDNVTNVLAPNGKLINTTAGDFLLDLNTNDDTWRIDQIQWALNGLQSVPSALNTPCDTVYRDGRTLSVAPANNGAITANIIKVATIPALGGIAVTYMLAAAAGATTTTHAALATGLVTLVGLIIAGATDWIRGEDKLTSNDALLLKYYTTYAAQLYAASMQIVGPACVAIEDVKKAIGLIPTLKDDAMQLVEQSQWEHAVDNMEKMCR